jgi:subtilisin family serine protease
LRRRPRVRRMGGRGAAVTAVRGAVVLVVLGLLLAGAVSPVGGPEGPYLSYLVSARQADPAGAAQAAADVRALGGQVVEVYRQIGVVLAYAPVVSSTAGGLDLGARLRRLPDIAAAGASRTAPAYGIPRERRRTEAYSGARVATTAREDAAGAADDIPIVPDPRETPAWNLAMLRPGGTASSVTSSDAALGTALHRVVVAVLDAGVDDTHPDLRNAVDPALSAACADGIPDPAPGAWRPDPDVGESGHGTHVAGIIGAARNGDGVVGVAPGVRIAAVRLLGAAGQYYGENLVCGFLWAADHGARVINDSYFSDPWKYNCPDDPDQSAIITAVGRAVRYAQQRGALVVASAGNDAQDLDAPRVDDRSPNDRVNGAAQVIRHLGPQCIRLPGGLGGVLDVSAIDQDGALAGYSNWGAGMIGLSAPGGDPDGGPGQAVVSDWPGGRYAALAGTSMAAAHVTGAAAIVTAEHPGASPDEVRRLLAAAAAPAPDCLDPRGHCPLSPYYGAGELRLPG